MWAAILSSVTGFISKQWQHILIIGGGLLVLARVKSYIEENAVTRAQKRHLQNAINQLKQNREFIDGYQEIVDDMARDDVISIMRQNGELRISGPEQQ